MFWKNRRSFLHVQFLGVFKISKSHINHYSRNSQAFRRNMRIWNLQWLWSFEIYVQQQNNHEFQAKACHEHHLFSTNPRSQKMFKFCLTILLLFQYKRCLECLCLIIMKQRWNVWHIQPTTTETKNPNMWQPIFPQHDICHPKQQEIKMFDLIDFDKFEILNATHRLT